MTQTTTQELAPGEPARQVFEEISRSGALPRDVTVEDAVQEVLCAITRRVGRTSAERLRFSLSPALGELMRECVVHRERDPELFGREELVHELAGHFRVDEARAERIARSVCAAVRHRFPIEELRAVESQLPGDVAKIWRG